jgi:hypothetical protein
MNLKTLMAFCVLATLSLGSAAQAESIVVNGSMNMEAGHIDILQRQPPSLGSPALRSIHRSVHRSGINTDGMITVLAAETAAGLSLFTLIDDDTRGSGFGSLDSMVGMTTELAGEANMYVNDVWSDIGSRQSDGSRSAASGVFTWNSERRGDGFAWAGLDEGEEGTFEFTHMLGDGLTTDRAFQFLTWTERGWEVMERGSFVDGVYGFSFAVVPLPPAVALGLVGLGIVAVRRRFARS